MADAIAVEEFPFMEGLPKRKASRLRTLMESFKQMKALTEKHGMLVPASAAAALIGVSRARIGQLMSEGRLQSIQFHGHQYITEESLFSWANSDRKGGRPAYRDVSLKEAVDIVARGKDPHA